MNESESEEEEVGRRRTNTWDSNQKEEELVPDKVVKKIKKDIFAADLKISVLVCALESYRYDSVLRPFPPVGLRDDGTKDVQKLTQLCNSLPKLSTLVKGDQSISDDAWELLDWIMNKTFDITMLDKSMFKEIEKRTGQPSYSSTQPDFIFEIEYNQDNVLNKRFLELAEHYDILYAYHGSAPDNFHSILHNGLHSHLNKNSLFGEGTYLSSDLNVSITYSKYSHLWNNSILGAKMSCMAVCEVLDHPDVKCTLEKKTRNGVERQSGTRARAQNSEGGDVPERYYVVTNNQLLRVKYLMVYAEKRKAESRTSPGTWFAWIIIFYILVLIILGLSRSRAFSNIQSKIFGSPHSQL
ncbi:protein mono-ADP-ribosyltransferase PARP16-like [Actinia tenebrosa]|uniref:Poly [ADP-ribose] polymerase n=1 Tax=Actinia tenebrosa TaxID=6105 RepID=A0A6P8IIA9_ACTTE|nr:protein mono-ADP-ribosyltransferase PARP16-like [Actinia tenebrosa]